MRSSSAASRSLIQLVSAGHRVQRPARHQTSAPVLPKLLLLILFTTFLVQMGMMLVLQLPGVLLAIVLAFAPIMLVQDQKWASSAPCAAACAA